MADQNSMGRGVAVALMLPVDQARFLRGLFRDVRAGVRQELKDYLKQLREPARQRREEAAYGRLLAGLEECEIVPDADVRVVVRDLAKIIDASNEYERVVSEHEALHDLFDRLKGGEGR